MSKCQPKFDADTDWLTEELTDAIARISGKRPYVVIAQFHRKCIDANRPPELAYESDLSKAAYMLASKRSEQPARKSSNDGAAAIC